MTKIVVSSNKGVLTIFSAYFEIYAFICIVAFLSFKNGYPSFNFAINSN